MKLSEAALFPPIIEDACRAVYGGDEQAMKKDFASQTGTRDDFELAVETTVRFGTEIMIRSSLRNFPDLKQDPEFRRRIAYGVQEFLK